jgi:hypothetical protein
VRAHRARGLTAVLERTDHLIAWPNGRQRPRTQARAGRECARPPGIPITQRHALDRRDLEAALRLIRCD